MSLNGLDTVSVKEAHDAAVAEPGGWFLLKYISRDEVDLLGRGNGGIVEMRNAIAQYEEPSPLFGLLRYRRRNVLIKYVPEDCSRLIQARVAVHFTAVAERFTPHETTFPIASSKDLRDTTLSAACSLHTASGSTSSSTSSLRRRRLMEIAEDEEENKAKRQSTVLEERPSTAGKSNPPTEELPVLPTTASPLPDIVSPAPSTTAIPLPPIKSLETSPPPPREREQAPPEEPRPRFSSQSGRPNLFSYSAYSSGRPKIKLGPRPSLDIAGRPHTTDSSSHYRPISTLPAGLKIFSRSSRKNKERPKSTYHGTTPSQAAARSKMTETTTSTSQNASGRPHTAGGRPNTSSGASFNVPSSVTAAKASRLPSITPEKARLLKALELRKKKKTTSTGSSTTPVATILEDVVPTIPEDPTLRYSLTDSLQQDIATLDILNEALRPSVSATAVDTATPPTTEEADITGLDDSGFAFDTVSGPKTDESDATRSDSYPATPVENSIRAESTKASSISDSTDETVTAANNGKEETLDVQEDSVHEDSTPVDGLSSDGAKLEPVKEPVMEVLDQPASIGNTKEHDPEVEPAGVESAATAGEQALSSEAKAEAEAPAQSATVVVDPSESSRDSLALSLPSVLVPDIEPATSISKDEIEPESSKQKGEQGDPVPVDDEALPKEEIDSQQPQTLADSSPVKTEVREMKIPRSKFSIPDLRVASTSDATEPLPKALKRFSRAGLAETIRSRFSTQETHTVEQTPGTSAEVNTMPSAIQQEAVASPKRKPLMEPIRTDLDICDQSVAESEANFSSDDDLMDELQSAVVQEAKPMSVSKSPMSPVFPSPTKANRFPRACSNPVKDISKSDTLSPPETSQTGSRSVSASTYLNRISQQAPPPAAKKVNLGSGISQRIKALEQLSSQAPGPAPAPGTSGPSTVVSPAFFSVRKSIVRPPSRTPSIADRASSLTKNSPSLSRDPSPEAFKLRERSGSIHNRLDSFNLDPASAYHTGRARPESISVTARIIRDPDQPFPVKPDLTKDPSDFAPLDLKQSPLKIDHQRAAPRESLLERRFSKEHKLERSSSVTSTASRMRDSLTEITNTLAEKQRTNALEPLGPACINTLKPPPSLKPVSGFQRPISLGGPVKTSTAPSMSPLPSSHSSPSLNEQSEKKPSSRAGRMLRRMSSSLTKGSKNIAHAISPTLKEELDVVPRDLDAQSIILMEPSNAPMVHSPTLADIGDVNVQFPDTLLWKRRSMALDSHGFLVLAPALSANKAGHKVTTRSFHLREFKIPMIPDVEMQELPNSVVLEFIEGSELQLACEDRAGQTRVLGVLQDAYNTWAV